MLDQTQYLLIKLIEEAAEVQHRATKALRFGLDEKKAGDQHNNSYLLREEIKDVLFTLRALDFHLGNTSFSGALSGNDRMIRETRMKKYTMYSKQLGILAECEAVPDKEPDPAPADEETQRQLYEAAGIRWFGNPPPVAAPTAARQPLIDGNWEEAAPVPPDIEAVEAVTREAVDRAHARTWVGPRPIADHNWPEAQPANQGHAIPPAQARFTRVFRQGPVGVVENRYIDVNGYRYTVRIDGDGNETIRGVAPIPADPVHVPEQAPPLMDRDPNGRPIPAQNDAPPVAARNVDDPATLPD